MMTETRTTTWTSPANIALVKYWGKRGNQLPQNPSISMTLSESVTTTSLTWSENPGSPSVSFLFEGEPEPRFESRVKEYLKGVLPLLPALKGFSLHISSRNSFPHSSGISSSASFMSSLALCLVRAEELLSGHRRSREDFFSQASFLARLGSGSAARSVYGGFTIWGSSGAVEDSSDLRAVDINELVHPGFKNWRDAVLVVSSRPKSLSSSAGHALMESNPYAPVRYEHARENADSLIGILGSGDVPAFIRLVEEEAMTLHGLIQASAGGPVLMEPGTLAIIRRIREFRRDTGASICFTLDAGPNVHLLYPESEGQAIRSFIGQELLPFCEAQRWIDDHVGTGGKELITKT